MTHPLIAKAFLFEHALSQFIVVKCEKEFIFDSVCVFHLTKFVVFWIFDVKKLKKVQLLVEKIKKVEIYELKSVNYAKIIKFMIVLNE